MKTLVQHPGQGVFEQFSSVGLEMRHLEPQIRRFKYPVVFVSRSRDPFISFESIMMTMCYSFGYETVLVGETNIETYVSSHTGSMIMISMFVHGIPLSGAIHMSKSIIGCVSVYLSSFGENVRRRQEFEAWSKTFSGPTLLTSDRSVDIHVHMWLLREFPSKFIPRVSPRF